MIHSPTELAADLKRYYEVVNQVYPVKGMFLFGSYARETMHKDSDIDVAVVVDRIPGQTKIDIGAKLFSLAAKVNVDIEPKCIFWDEYIDPPQASILQEIISTGKEIVG